jgi:hypothetical protein
MCQPSLETNVAPYFKMDQLSRFSAAIFSVHNWNRIVAAVEPES